MEKRVTLQNGEAKLVLADNGEEETSIVAVEKGSFKILNKNVVLFINELTQKKNLIDWDNRCTLEEDVTKVELLSDGQVLFADKKQDFYLLKHNLEKDNLGRECADGACFFAKFTLTYRKKNEVNGKSGLAFLWCETADLNELNGHQLICKELDGDVYTVLRMVDEKHKYWDFSQASLIYCRVKGREFVLHFNPNQGHFEKIELKRPSMRRRCNKIFANENFLVKNAKKYGEFLAPRSWGEYLYDVKEYLAAGFDNMYIKLRQGINWMW